MKASKRRLRHGDEPLSPPVTQTEPDGPLEIFRAGVQGVKVRAIQALGLAMGVASLWFVTYILRAADPGLTLAGRVALAALFTVFGLTFTVGLGVYGWCYVTRVVWDPDAQRCNVSLAGLFVPVHLDVEPATAPRVRFHEGQSHKAGFSVNAPWYGVRLPGRRLPLILDMGGDFLRPDLVDRVLLGEVTAPGILFAQEAEEARRKLRRGRR